MVTEVGFTVRTITAVAEVVGIATEPRERRLTMVRVVMVTQMGLQVERVRDMATAARTTPGSMGRGLVDLVVEVVLGTTRNIDRAGVVDTQVVKVLLMNG
jgi:hypothetical protein